MYLYIYICEYKCIYINKYTYSDVYKYAFLLYFCYIFTIPIHRVRNLSTPDKTVAPKVMEATQTTQYWTYTISKSE